MLSKSLFYKVVGLRVCNFIKKKLQHRCFPVKFAKFLWTAILKNVCERLLLHILFFAAQFWYVNWSQIKTFFFQLRRSKKNFTGCINDTFCRTTTLYSSFLSWRFATFLSLHVLSEDSMFVENSGFLKRGNYWTVSTRVAMYSILSPLLHLPQEISRVTKFIIEWGATVDVELTSNHYRSP